MKKRKKHNKAYGKALFQFRTERGFTQEELGFECDLSRHFIYLLEQGESSATMDTTMALCAGLGVRLTQFMERVEAIMTPVSRNARTDNR